MRVRFSLILALVCNPAIAAPNDQFGAAEDLGSSETVSVSLDTQRATRQVGEPAHDSNDSLGSVWWKWQAPADGRWEIAVDESPYYLAVYTGTALENLTLVAEEGNETLRVEVTAGERYYLAMAREGLSRLDFSFVRPPSNDDFAERTSLGNAASVSVKGTTVAGSREEREPQHSGDSSQGPSSWWEWEAPADGVLRFDLAGTPSADWIVAVYSGSALSRLEEVAARSSGLSGESQTAFRVEEGRRYVFAAALSTPDQEGAICLNLEFDAVVNNDRREDAVDLGNAAPLRFSGDTTGATDDDGGSDRTIWWKWTCPGNGEVTFEVDQSATSWAGWLAVYRELADSSPAVVAQPSASAVSFQGRGGETYLLEAGSGLNSGQAVTIDLRFSAAEANDDFAEAAPLLLGDNRFDLSFASIEEGEPGFSPIRSLWWTWTAPEDGVFRMKSEFDHMVRAEVYTGESLEELTSLPASGRFAATAGVTYHLQVSTFTSSPKRGGFRASFIPFDTGHDDFANAVDLGAGWSVQGASSLEGATLEPDEPDAGGLTAHSVWWKWTAPAACVFDVESAAFPNSGWLRTYIGESLSELVRPQTVSGSYEAEQGQVFYFAFRDVFGENTYVDFDLRAHAIPPPNDAFTEAIDLGGRLEWDERVHFYQATRGSEEPEHVAGSAAPHTLWWIWTCPVDKNVEITLDATFSSQVAVYRGTALDDLEAVAADEGSVAVVSFAAEAGETYRIALASSQPGPGTWTLLATDPPAGDRFGDAIDLGSQAVGRLAGAIGLASFSPGDPEPNEALHDQNLWYRWTAPADGLLDIVFTTFIGGELRLFAGAAQNSLRELDVPARVGAGEEFYVLQEAWRQSTPQEVRFFEKPPNDRFANASDWGSQRSAMASVNVSAASLEAGEPEVFDPDSAAPGSVWWRWTAPLDGAVTIRTTFRSGRGSAVALFLGEELHELVEVDRVATTSSEVLLRAEVRAGTSYAIMAGAEMVREEVPLSIELEAFETPSNDRWPMAFDLGSDGTAAGSGTNVGAAPVEVDGVAVPGGAVWWKWTAPKVGSAFAFADIADQSERVFVYREEAGVLHPVTTSEFDAGASGWGEGWAAVAGESYYLAVAGRFQGSVGPVEIAVFQLEAPPNDRFADRTILPAEPDSVQGTTVGALLEADERSHTIGTESRSVWWTWTAPATGPYQVALTSQSALDGMAIYTGSELNDLTKVVRVHDRGAWWAEEGTTYQLAVADRRLRGGPVSFTLEPLPRVANDDFAERTSLGERQPVRLTAHNLGATAQPGEPAHAGSPAAQSVWFEWTAPSPGGVFIDAGESSPAVNVAVYQGTELEDLTVVASGKGAASFTTLAGRTYAIAVDDDNLGAGLIHLDISQGENPNDNFEDRIVLGGYDAVMSGDVTFATREPGEPNPWGRPLQTLWWEWTAPSSATIEIRRVGGISPDVQVYSIWPGAPRRFSSLRSEGSFGSFMTLRPQTGTTYFFQVGVSASERRGEVHLRLSARGGVPPDSGPGPANDDFRDRVSLPPTVPVRGAVDLKNGSNESGEPISGRYFGAWWSWVAPASGLYRIARDDEQSFVGVFTGSDVNALTTVLAPSRSGLFEAEAGVEYSIVVQVNQYYLSFSGREDRMAGFTLTSGPPASSNDRFADRIDLGTRVGSAVTGNNIGAGAEPEEPAHAGVAAERSVWWTWTAPESRAYRLSAAGGAMRAGLYTGTDLGSLEEIASGIEPLVFQAVEGTTYQIAIDHSGVAEFLFAVSETVPPPPPATNDSFADAVVAEGTLVTFLTTAEEATLESGEPLHGSDESQGGSLWWSWTAPEEGRVTISTDRYARISVYLGGSLQSLHPFLSFASSVEFHAQAGTTYRIAVSDVSGTPFGLTIDQTEAETPGDQFADALALTGTSVEVSGTTLGATVEHGEPRHVDDHAVPRHSVWYTWTCPESDLYELRQTDVSPARLAVYTGDDPSSLLPEGFGDEALTFFATEGTEYRIAVAYLSSPGDFELTLDKVGYAANDDFADRIALGTSSGVTMTGSIRNSTREDGEPFHHNDTSLGGSVWWSWTASHDGQAVLQADRSLILAAYTGSRLNELVLVEKTTSQSLVFSTSAGVQYQIAIGGFSPTGGAGEFEFAIWHVPPANDNFAERLELPGTLPVEVEAENYVATAELGEPRPMGFVSDASLWWEWTPAQDMVVDFSWSSLAGIYTGEVFAFLEPVEGAAVGRNILRFAAQGGTSYLIAAGSFSGSGVSFTLREARDPSPNDNFADAIALEGEDLSAASHSVGAASEPGEPIPTERSIWWKWTAPRSGLVEVAAEGGTPYVLAPAGSLSELELLERWRGNLFRVEEGLTYPVMVDAPDGSDVRLSLKMTPAGDLFDDAIELGESMSLGRSAVLEGATWEPLEAFHAGAPAKASVWFRWIAPSPASGPVRLTAGEPGQKVRLAVYTGTELTGVSPVAEGISELSFSPEAGRAYRFALDAPSHSGALDEVDFQLTGEGSAYDAWRSRFFADPADAAGDPLANPDGDRFLNLFEMAFGTNPGVADFGDIPFAVDASGDSVILSVVRPVGVDGVRYTFEVSRTLRGDWQRTDELDRREWTEDHGDGTETLLILLEDFDPAAEPSLMARLRVDLE